MAHFRAGQLSQALTYFHRAIELGGGQAAQHHFMRCLFGLRFTAPAPSLRPMLVRALRETWAAPADAARVAANLILVEPAYREALRAAEFGAADFDGPALRQIIGDQLLLTMSDRAIINAPPLEHLLTAMRRGLLLRVDGKRRQDEDLLPFLAALSNQCFANEYAYAESDAEAAAANSLCEDVASILSRGERPAPASLAMAGCYRALARFTWSARVLETSWPRAVAAMITRQISEPATDRQLAASIPHLTPIREGTSQAVAAQYAENPFPRWIAPQIPPKHREHNTWLQGTFPNAPPLPPGPDGVLDVLVAGCGTGQETAGLARLLRGVKILAIDLSLPSLAYAKRKSADLGLDNITYACADILEIARLGRSFDMVVSAGVLHHLKDVTEGLRALAGVTRPGGSLLIALYSELGRRALAPARDFVRQGGYGVTPDELRRFRKAVYALPETVGWRADLLGREDFYSLSMLRDLLFHVQESRFTIDSLGAIIAQSGLRFCGFAAEPGLYPAFARRFGPKADPLDLAQWKVFEQENPDAFGAMYHFLLHKPHS